MSEKNNPLEKAQKLTMKYALENAIKYSGEAQEKSVMQKIMATHAELRKFAGEIKDQVERTVKEVNAMKMDEQRALLTKIAPELMDEKDSKKQERELPKLQNAIQGKVVTRYAPEPNGEMHLGHAFTAFFAHYYAKKYSGKFILRFEDTNPKNERIEFMDAHREALTWLGLEPDEEVIVSNDMGILYQKAEQLIKQNHAYTCTCSVDVMREFRNQEKSCKHALKTNKETLADWKKMLAGDFKEGEIVLRLRGDMQSKNAVMRDPAIFTIRNDTHCIQGDDYIVWPLYDFAVAIEDHLCGITHVGRSAEFDTRIELQNKIRELLGLVPHPLIFHYARFNVIGSPASKRMIKPLVEAKKVEGWDDIRLVTIKGLKRRGIIPETIKELAKEVGITTQPTNIDWSLLSAINRKLIDGKANRYFFIDEPVVLFVRNAPEGEKAELHYHPDKPELGARKIPTTNYFLIPKSDYETLKDGEEFRLKELYNVKIEKKNINLLKPAKKDDINSFLDEKTSNFIKKFDTHVIASYTDNKLKPGPKIQWTVASPKATIPVEVKVPDVLFIDNEFNENSLETLNGIGEKAIKNLEIGEIVQFERFGFVRVDSKKKGKVYVNLAHK